MITLYELRWSHYCEKIRWAKIAQDPRHRGIMVLLQEHQAQRAFAEWSMAFRDLNSEDVKRIPGYHEFMNVNFMDRAFFEQPSRAQRLLMTFRRSM